MKQVPGQLSLFEENNRAMKLAGLVPSVKAAMARAAGASLLSRDEICDRMNAIAQSAGVRMTKGNAKTISPETLDKWLCPQEREHAPSLIAVNVFCLALNDPGPLAVQLGLHGYEIMTGEDRKFRDYGRACAKERQARQVKKRIEEDLR